MPEPLTVATARATADLLVSSPDTLWGQPTEHQTARNEGNLPPASISVTRTIWRHTSGWVLSRVDSTSRRYPKTAPQMITSEFVIAPPGGVEPDTRSLYAVRDGSKLIKLELSMENNHRVSSAPDVLMFVIRWLPSEIPSGRAIVNNWRPIVRADPADIIGQFESWLPSEMFDIVRAKSNS